MATPVPTATGTIAAGSVRGRAPFSQSPAVATVVSLTAAARAKRAEVAHCSGGGGCRERGVHAQRLADRALTVGRAVAAQRGQQPLPAGGVARPGHVGA